MIKYRYFAQVEETDNGWLVKDIYQAEHNSPICQYFLNMGYLESTY
jgi:hypothetical protein